MYPALALFLLSAAPAAPSASKEAEALFLKARDLFKTGKAAEACPLFEKSHSLEPALGTLLNLADCEERTGRLVQAYLHFNEATAWAQRTREGKREQVASSRASGLKSRLSWLSLSTAFPTPNLVVAAGELKLQLSATPQSVPVDAGETAVTASAPGFESWTTRVKVGPAQTQAVMVPALVPQVELKKPPELPPPLVAAPSADFVPSPFPTPTQPAPAGVQQSYAPPARPAGPIALISAGGVLAISGTAGLIWSLRTYDGAMRQQPGGPDAAAPTVTRSQFDTLRWLYPASWAAVGVGAAALASGAAWQIKGTRATAALLPAGSGVAVSLAGEL